MDDIQDMLDNINDVQDVVERQRKQKKYFPQINPFEKYDDTQFRIIYRFKKETNKNLIEEVRPSIHIRDDNKGRQVSAEIQVLSTIRYLAKGNYQSETADLHNFSQATMSRIAGRVTRAIASLIERYLNFPQNDR